MKKEKPLNCAHVKKHSNKSNKDLLIKSVTIPDILTCDHCGEVYYKDELPECPIDGEA